MLCVDGVVVVYHNHCSKWTWVVKVILAYGNRLRSTHCREFDLIRHYADPLTLLELLNYYLTLAISSGRFAYYVIQSNDTTNDSIFHISGGMQAFYSKILFPYYSVSKVSILLQWEDLEICQDF